MQQKPTASMRGASAAHEAGVDPLSLKVLMNHALPSASDVTEGYIRPSVEHLRDATERIAAFLQEKMGDQPLPGTQVG